MRDDEPAAGVGEDARRAPMTAERPEQPELLADDREDEVVVRLGQPAPLLPARAEAHAPASRRRRGRSGRASAASAAAADVACRCRASTSKRPSRLGLVTTMTVARAATAGDRRSRSSGPGTPATKSMPATIAASTRVVPEVVAEQDEPDREHGDGEEEGHDDVRRAGRGPWRLRARIGAPTRISPSLTTSEGWSGHRRRAPIQLRLPETSTPSGLKTRHCSAIEARKARTARLRIALTGSRMRDEEPDDADAGEAPAARRTRV